MKKQAVGSSGITYEISASNALESLSYVLHLISRQRLLAAKVLFESLEAFVSKMDKSSPIGVVINQNINKSMFELNKMKIQANECLAALLEAKNDSDWIHGLTVLDVDTSYKIDKDDGSLWIKLSGTLKDVPVFEQLSIVKEIDLFKHWAPFCNHSAILHKFGPVELLAHLNLAIPMLSRDCVLYANAVDCTYEENAIVVVGKSIDNIDEIGHVIKPGFHDLTSLPKRTGMFQDRMIVKGFKACIRLLSPTEVETVIVGNIDPRAPLPTPLIHFLIRNIAGVFLHLLQRQGRETVNNPMDCIYAVRMRQEHEFYMKWLMPKYEEYCSIRGWTDPPIITTLLSRSELKKLEEKERRSNDNHQHNNSNNNRPVTMDMLGYNPMPRHPKPSKFDFITKDYVSVRHACQTMEVKTAASPDRRKAQYPSSPLSSPSRGLYYDKVHGISQEKMSFLEVVGVRKRDLDKGSCGASTTSSTMSPMRGNDTSETKSTVSSSSSVSALSNWLRRRKSNKSFDSASDVASQSGQAASEQQLSYADAVDYQDDMKPISVTLQAKYKKWKSKLNSQPRTTTSHSSSRSWFKFADESALVWVSSVVFIYIFPFFIAVYPFVRYNSGYAAEMILTGLVSQLALWPICTSGIDGLILKADRESGMFDETRVWISRNIRILTLCTHAAIIVISCFISTIIILFSKTFSFSASWGHPHAISLWSSSTTQLVIGSWTYYASTISHFLLLTYFMLMILIITVGKRFLQGKKP